MKIIRVTLILFLVLFSNRSRAAEPELPQEVRSVLEANARSLTNLTIAGARSQRMLAPASEVLKAIGTLESEAEFTKSVKFTLQLQGVKIREAYRYPANPPYKSGNGVDESSYDGTKYFNGSIDRSKPTTPGNLMIQNPATIKSTGVKMFLWYLFEAGFSGPTLSSEMGRPIESLVLARAAAGRIESVKEISQAGQKLLEVVVEYPEPWASKSTAAPEKMESIKSLRDASKQLQIKVERERRRQAGEFRRSRFHLDRSMGYAVREAWELRAKDGAVMFHTTNSDFRQLERGGLWLPRRCEVVSHAHEMAPRYTSPQPLYATHFQIDTIEPTTFSDDLFRIWYDEPGIFVSDATDPRSTPGRPYSYHTSFKMPPEVIAEEQDRSWLFFGAIAALALVVAGVLSTRSHRNRVP